MPLGQQLFQGAGTPDNTARVSEIRVWPATVGNVPPLPIKLDLLSPVSIFLNQTGFNAGAPKRFTYEAPKDPKLWGKLQPPFADAPDLVKLIHWGADVIVTQNLTHELLKSQFAYSLYAWPALKDYLPAQNYEVVRDFAFATWTSPKADLEPNPA